MAADPPKQSYPQFSLSDSTNFKFNFRDSTTYEDKQQLPPPPPSTEVDLSEASLDVKTNMDSISVADGVALLKGRVNTSDVFGVSDFDLIPGKYEGGLKLWEGSLDLVKVLKSEVDNGRLLLDGKRVFELGCGHGLPGIYAGVQGAVAVHFQDFNAEVLRCLTIPNVKANLIGKKTTPKDHNDQKEPTFSLDVRFFAGDWREIHHLLLWKNVQESQAHEEEMARSGYDIILMAETFYSIPSIQHLYELTKKCLRHPNGVVYLAGKKHYFGVGGGTRQFLNVVNEDGVMEAMLLAQVTDGSSNVREVWKLCLRSAEKTVTTDESESRS